MVLLMPGGRPDTLSLLHTLASELGVAPEKLHSQHYQFWQNGDADLSRELAHLPGGHVDWVIAKSMGTLLFAEAVLRGQIRFSGAVLIGVPLPIMKDMGVGDNAFTALDLKRVLFVQQANDKLCSAQTLRTAISPPHMHVIPGSDHAYLQTDFYIEAMRKFLNPYPAL